VVQRRSVLSSKTSPGVLPKANKPEWEVVAPGVRLGYRRGRGTHGRGGSWLAAARTADSIRQQTRLGKADDLMPADGVKVLDHEQAKAAARLWAKSIKAGNANSPALTVNDVLDRYFEARAAEGMKAVQEARGRAAFHIPPNSERSALPT
jgi:hypothetical protein